MLVNRCLSLTCSITHGPMLSVIVQGARIGLDFFYWLQFLSLQVLRLPILNSFGIMSFVGRDPWLASFLVSFICFLHGSACCDRALIIFLSICCFSLPPTCTCEVLDTICSKPDVDSWQFLEAYPESAFLFFFVITSLLRE